MWLDRTKPTIEHLCHRSSSLVQDHNVTTILNAEGASVKVSHGGDRITDNVPITVWHCLQSYLSLRKERGMIWILVRNLFFCCFSSSQFFFETFLLNIFQVPYEVEYRSGGRGDFVFPSSPVFETCFIILIVPEVRFTFFDIILIWNDLRLFEISVNFSTFFD